MDHAVTIVLLTLINFILAILFLMNLINLFGIKKLYPHKKNSCNVSVSVLIPARNEEINIERCLRSILEQNYGNFEIIVLNDNSTDKTAEIVKSVNDVRLRMINGENLEKGWVGKNYACHQLQAEAKGEYLLFIDADTELNKDCISSAVTFAVENKTGLLSIMPWEISVTFWEKLVIPMLYFAVMAFLPVPLIEHSKKREFSMGNGQFMLFKRSCYDIIGGHESLKNKIVEDVWLSRRVKEFGQKLIFADGTDIVKCRMYGSLNEVWNGFSKNFFAGLAFSKGGLIAVIITYFILFILPVITLIYGMIISDQNIFYLSITAYIIPVIIRITHSFKFNQPFLFSYVNFLSCIFLISVSINSFRILKFGKGANWKGRNYSENEIK